MAPVSSGLAARWVFLSAARSLPAPRPPASETRPWCANAQSTYVPQSVCVFSGCLEMHQILGKGQWCAVVAEPVVAWTENTPPAQPLDRLRIRVQLAEHSIIGPRSFFAAAGAARHHTCSPGARGKTQGDEAGHLPVAPHGWGMRKDTLD
jgi:hypothetical protein